MRLQIYNYLGCIDSPYCSPHLMSMPCTGSGEGTCSYGAWLAKLLPTHKGWLNRCRIQFMAGQAYKQRATSLHADPNRPCATGPTNQEAGSGSVRIWTLHPPYWCITVCLCQSIMTSTSLVLTIPCKQVEGLFKGICLDLPHYLSCLCRWSKMHSIYSINAIGSWSSK